ncbi:MAG TPA: hypothetical protein VE987_22250 [Polyangiaceae bacterium]|nr:hypothetical protein [Polyangiaceae bacterium]
MNVSTRSIESARVVLARPDLAAKVAACELAGVEPKFEDFEGTEYEALRKVISLNLHRRHLNESQRAMVGARIATLGPGGDQRSDHSANWRNGMTAAEASETLNVSTRSIERARVVLAHPEIAAQVDAGELKVSAAAKLARPAERLIINME